MALIDNRFEVAVKNNGIWFPGRVLGQFEQRHTSEFGDHDDTYLYVWNEQIIVVHARCPFNTSNRNRVEVDATPEVRVAALTWATDQWRGILCRQAARDAVKVAIGKLARLTTNKGRTGTAVHYITGIEDSADGRYRKVYVVEEDDEFNHPIIADPQHVVVHRPEAYLWDAEFIEQQARENALNFEKTLRSIEREAKRQDSETVLALAEQHQQAVAALKDRVFI